MKYKWNTTQNSKLKMGNFLKFHQEANFNEVFKSHIKVFCSFNLLYKECISRVKPINLATG